VSSAGRHAPGSPKIATAEPPNLKTDFCAPRLNGWCIWTVSWTAVQNKPDIYIRNERQVNILETEHFGRQEGRRPAATLRAPRRSPRLSRRT
jgi:hypothetical protein